jgi:hypothetical protein
MPGFDGTGPMGLGPLTGRGMGFCAVKLSPSGKGERLSLNADRASVGRALVYQSPGTALPLGPRLSLLVPGLPRGFRHGWNSQPRGSGFRR